MNVLNWAPFPEADVATYRVYRSMIGFRAPLVPLATLNGKTLQLKMNGGATQTITFNAVTPIVDKINAVLTGGRAYASVNDPTTYWLLRSDVRTAPGTVQIVGGTALADFGLTARTISEQSEDLLVSSVPADPDPQAIIEFVDNDGAIQDFYAVTTLDSMGNESLKSNYRQPISATGPLCVLEGIVTSIQGVRTPDVEVKATLLKFPHSPAAASHITLEPVTTLTGSDGRFSLPLLQTALVQLEIPAIGYTRAITVPAKAYEFVTDLKFDTDYQYPLGGEA